jgi:hypothetical protein
MDSESALGTADNGIDKDIRLAGPPTVPTATRELEAQANLGHEGATQFLDDKPLAYETGRESSLTLPIKIRRGATTGIPPLMYFLQSGGWTITDSAVDTVTAGAPAVDDFDATASILGAADTYGAAVLVESVANTYWEPALLAKYDDAPDKSCVPAMDLPAIAAVGGDIIRMRTATVNPSEVGAAETLTFVLDTRGDYTAAPDLAYTYSGCALADLGPIEINKEGSVTLNPVFHVADISVGAGALDAASFLSGDGTSSATSHVQRQESSNFKVQYGTFAAAGGITNGTLQMESATITPNITTIPVIGIGGTNVNGWQSYMQKVAMPTIDLTVIADHDFIDSATKGYESVDANEFTYLAFVWGTTDLDVPSYGFFFPACRQIAPPELDPFNEKYQLMTLHFGASAPKFTGGATTNTSTAMSPMYIAIHGND